MKDLDQAKAECINDRLAASCSVHEKWSEALAQARRERDRELRAEFARDRAEIRMNINAHTRYLEALETMEKLNAERKEKQNMTDLSKVAGLLEQAASALRDVQEPEPYVSEYELEVALRVWLAETRNDRPYMRMTDREFDERALGMKNALRSKMRKTLAAVKRAQGENRCNS
jgi:hypothetical protein